MSVCSTAAAASSIGHRLGARGWPRRRASSPVEKSTTARPSRRPRRSSARITRVRARACPASTSATSKRRSSQACAAAAPLVTHSWSRPSRTSAGSSCGAHRRAPDHEHAGAPGQHRRAERVGQLLGVDRLRDLPLAEQRLVLERIDTTTTGVRRSRVVRAERAQHVDAALARHEHVEGDRVEAGRSRSRSSASSPRVHDLGLDAERARAARRSAARCRARRPPRARACRGSPPAARPRRPASRLGGQPHRERGARRPARSRRRSSRAGGRRAT